MHMFTCMARINLSQKELKTEKHSSNLNLFGFSQKYSATESLTDCNSWRSVCISAKQTSAS